MKDRLPSMKVRIGAAAAAAILVLVIIVLTFRHNADTQTAPDSAASSDTEASIESSNISAASDSSQAESDTSLSEDYTAIEGDPEFQVPTWSAEGGEAHASEGLNVPGGTEVGIREGTPVGEIGKAYGFPTSGQNYTMTIDSIGYGNTTQDGKKVLEVRYTYHNINVDNLMVGQYSFKMLDKNQKALDVYYFNQDVDPIYGMQPASPGNSWTCIIGFVSNSDCKQVTLIYEDPINPTYEQMVWTVKP